MGLTREEGGGGLIYGSDSPVLPPPLTGLAPWLSLSSIILQLSRVAFSLNCASSKVRFVVPAPHPK